MNRLAIFLKLHSIHNLFKCSGIIPDIIPGTLSRFIQERIITKEAIHQLNEIFLSMNFKTTLTLLQSLSFQEFPVLGTENHRNP